MVSWWESYGWPAIPTDFLSPNGILVQSKDGMNMCVGFVYKTDSSVSWIEYITGNPNISKEDRSDAIDLLLDVSLIVAKEGGASAVFSAFGQNSLVKKCIQHGFEAIGTDVTNLMREV